MSGSNKNTYYNTADIERYLNGELSASEMHALEKASLEDPFLCDALEGMKKDRLERETSFSDKDVPELKKRLADRIGRKNRRVLNMPSARYPWRMVASVVLLAGLCGLSYYTFTGLRSDKRPLAAANKETDQESRASSADTTSQKTETQKTNTQKPGTSAAENPQPVVARNTGKISEKKKARNTGRARTVIRTDTLSSGDKKTADESSNEDLAAALPGLKTEIPVYNAPLLFPDKHVYTGRVTGADDKPIAFASILLDDRAGNATTDSSGSFSLHFSGPDTILHVTIRSAGYEALTTALHNNGYLPSGEDHQMNNINLNFRSGPDKNIAYSNQIRLQPSGMALNEVVVTGYGITRSNRAISTQSPQLPQAGSSALAGKVAGISISDKRKGGKQKALVQHTEPSVGWEVYNSYLMKNKKIGTADSLLTGDEVLSFLVNRNGGYSSFRIEHSLSAVHDAEAIRLVKEGPAWRLLKGKKERATLIISF